MKILLLGSVLSDVLSRTQKKFLNTSFKLYFDFVKILL